MSATEAGGLNVCPFCGSDGAYFCTDTEADSKCGHTAVACLTCMAYMYGTTREKAAEAWNQRRAADPRPAGESDGESAFSGATRDEMMAEIRRRGIERDEWKQRAEKAEARVAELEKWLSAGGMFAETVAAFIRARETQADAGERLWRFTEMKEALKRERFFAKILEQPATQPSATAEQKAASGGRGQWIACSERLPEDGQFVLTWRPTSPDGVRCRMGRYHRNRDNLSEFTDINQDRYWIADWWMMPTDPRPAAAHDGAAGGEG